MVIVLMAAIAIKLSLSLCVIIIKSLRMYLSSSGESYLMCVVFFLAAERDITIGTGVGQHC